MRKIQGREHRLLRSKNVITANDRVDGLDFNQNPDDIFQQEASILILRAVSRRWITL